VRVQVGFRDKVMAVGKTAGGKVTWQGGGKNQVEYSAAYYSKTYDVTGDDLLRLMVDRMNGMWWAEPIKDLPPRPANRLRSKSCSISARPPRR
jgi:hypothetical protein